MLVGSVNRVFAANFVGYNLSSCSPSCGTGSCDNPACSANQCPGGTNNCEGAGEILIAPFAGTLQSISFQTTTGAGSGLPNQFIILTAASGSLTHIGQSPCDGSSSTCAKENAGDSFTIADVEGLSGLAANTYTTVLLAGTVTVTQGQFVAVVLQNTANENLFITAGWASCPCFTTVYRTFISFSSSAATNTLTCGGATQGAPVVGNLACSDVGPSADNIIGGTFIPSTSPVTLVTSCFGNCGSPPITLANTNSTHSVAFNSSLTLFYEFQSQVNGFLLNVTTSVSKNYINGQTLTLGAYTTGNACQGSIPFSQSCPGLLQASKSINNPTKGQSGNSIVISGNSFAVSNGQWVAIALSGVFGPLDINDTNTNVAIFQTQGTVPALLSQTASFNANYKMGLWAWIAGNVVTGGNVPSVSSGCQSFATIDCWLPALVNGQCQVVTSSCQASSSLLWAVVLSLISIGIIGFTFGKAAPSVRIPFGEMFMVIFLGWIFMETGLSLVFVWVPVFFFFIAAIVFSKHTGRYF